LGYLHIYLPDDLHKELKRIALENNIALKDLVVSVLRNYAEGKLVMQTSG